MRMRPFSFPRAAIAVALLFVAAANGFCQSAKTAPAEFIAAVEAADIGAISDMLASDPALARSIDGDKRTVAYRAFKSPQALQILTLFLDAGLSPISDSEAGGTSILSEAAFRGDVPIVLLLAEALAPLGPDAWARPYNDAIDMMKIYEHMSSDEIAASATRVAIRGGDQDEILQRVAVMMVGRRNYPAVRKALASRLRFPTNFVIDAFGGGGMSSWPYVDGGDDKGSGFAPFVGATATMLFPAGRLETFYGGKVVPFQSLGLYASARDTMMTIDSEPCHGLSITGGVEWDLLRMMYVRLGGGYLFSSLESRILTDKAVETYDEATGQSSTSAKTGSVAISGPIFDGSVGVRFFIGDISASLAFPFTLRVGFPPLSAELLAFEYDVEQQFLSIGMALGVGLKL